VDELVKTIERSKQAARQHLDRYVREHLGEAGEAETMVAESLPVPAIVNAAQEQNADLIVMGTHGRSGVSRVMLGSVTERVLRETDRPVLTVRQKSEAAEPLTASIRRVLCPVNYTEVAMNALESAVAVAECFKAELMNEHASEQLCDWLSEDARRRCNLQELIRRGDAAEQIIEVARSLGSDLIVLGAQHKRFFDSTVIGTTTVRVTRHAPCPVLTVTHKP
jgi:nucleotide-binding universal stress UspA family protein